MKLITKVSEFINKREYWIRTKADFNKNRNIYKVEFQELVGIPSKFYWHGQELTDIDMIFDVFDVIGPCPEDSIPDFDMYVSQS